LFPVRLHHITALDTLDRKRLEENFLFWAERFNRIEDFVIARRTLTRNKFTIDAVEDMWWNRRDHESGLTYQSLMGNPIIGGAGTTIRADRASEYVMEWTCNFRLVSGAAAGRFLRIVPFAAGQLLWQGADILQHEWPLTLTGGDWVRDTQSITNPGVHSLNGRAYFSTTNASFEVGLVAAPETEQYIWDDSNFDARSIQLVVRRPY